MFLRSEGLGLGFDDRRGFFYPGPLALKPKPKPPDP